MRKIRIIPRLDIKGPNLIKGVHLEGLRIIGDPSHFAQKYYQDGADEMIYIDSVASLYERNNILEIVKETANEIFIPLTVGGGYQKS
jgi:cyclase